MPLLIKMDRDIIDTAINELLALLYTLPKEAAIAALAELSRIQMVGLDVKNYPPLPTLFENKDYQTKGIQYVLKELSEIMYNGQPQNPAKFSDDQSEIQHGKFNLLYLAEDNSGLISRSGATITSQDVHEYMRYKFAVAAFNVVALEETRNLINHIKNDASKKNRYYKYFARWVSEEMMSEAMRDFLLSDNNLKQDIKKALQACLTQKNFKIFQPYLDKNEFEIKEAKTESSFEEKEANIPANPIARDAENITIKNIIQDNLFSLDSSTFDREMDAALNTLFLGISFSEETYRKLQVFNTPSYRGVQEKLQAQIEDPSEYFSLEVILSFLKIAETQEILNLYGDVMKANNVNLVTECQKICQDYVNHLATTSEDQQVPLKKEEMDKLKQALENAKEFIKEQEFIDWTSDFFSLYFKSQDTSEQTLLLTKMFYFAFEQKRVPLPDNWLYIIYNENVANQAPEEKGFLNIKPYHINLVLIHALTLPVESWSSSYYDMLNQVLNLLASPDGHLNQMLIQDSYPPEFIAQIHWLRDRYASEVLHAGEIPPKPPEKFPILHYPQNLMSFSRILSLLSPDRIGMVLERIRNQWSDLVKTARQYFYLLESLDPYKRTAVYEIFKNNLPQLINEGYDFWVITELLNSDQRTEVYNTLQTKFPEIINATQDFYYVLRCLNPDQISHFCQSLQSKLPQLVKIGIPFNNLLENLSPNNITTLCENLKPELFQRIKRAEDMRSLFNNLNSDQITAVCESLKPLLPTILKNADDLATIVSYLPKDQLTAVCESFKSQFLQIIRTSGGHVSIQWLREETRNAIYESIKNQLPEESIKALKYIGNIFSFLPPNERTVLYEQLKNQLPELLRNEDNAISIFRSFLYYLNSTQRTEILENLKSLLPQIVKNPFNLSQLFRSIDPVEIKFICEILKDQLPQLIKTKNDLCLIFLDTDLGRISTVYENLKPIWLQVINSPDAMYSFLQSLDPKRKAAICEILESEQRSQFVERKREASEPLEKRDGFEALEISLSTQPLLKNRTARSLSQKPTFAHDGTDASQVQPLSKDHLPLMDKDGQLIESKTFLNLAEMKTEINKIDKSHKKAILQSFLSYCETTINPFVSRGKLVENWATCYQSDHKINPFEQLTQHRERGCLKMFNPSKTASIQFFEKFLEGESISQKLRSMLDIAPYSKVGISKPPG